VASTAAVPQASSPQASSVAAPAASTADSRATAFEAVQGGTETKSGTVLMVEAYAIIWVLLAGWVLLTFRKAERMHARLQDLEAALDRAAAAKDSKTGKGAAGS
jgi:CcmD family protein